MSSTENSPVHRRPNVQILETLKKKQILFHNEKVKKILKTNFTNKIETQK